MPRSLYILAALIGPVTGALAAQGTDALILNALRAAPPAVAQGATVVDGKHAVLPPRLQRVDLHAGRSCCPR